MFSHFFIKRPIFAAVLSIVITLAGGVAVVNLPIAQYPQITPPSIIVMCNYPGADARVVAESVAAPIEQQVNGVEDMMYMVSQSNNDGSYQLTVTFKPGVNLNFAQVLVQNRINLALPLLPDVVKQAGVTTRKRTPDILMVVGLYSPHGRYNQLYLSNYATIKIADEMKRVDGVGDVIQFGQQDYSMRLWIDPQRLAELGLTAADVANAVRQENMQVAAGHFGQQPQTTARSFEFPITVVGRLTEPAEFEDIVIRSDSAGRKVRLKDVGHAELGAKNLDTTSKLDGQSNGSVAIFALPDANAIATAERVRARMEQLKKSFPEDVDYKISLDMTPFITESIREVIRTLIEAIVLVAIVVLLFLQNWRSALIPLIAVPVAIVGTFAVMAAIGFSLNSLTLFGLVLAIGIVVDDAIVVVEAVEHHIEEGMTPRAAAHKAMDEVSRPVVAVALVLSAVFVPCAFITGITGMFFRQFALTIAVSTILSAFNSLTLSPALAALLLKPRDKARASALPWLGYVVGGGLAGLLFLPPTLAGGLAWLEQLFQGNLVAPSGIPWLASLLSALQWPDAATALTAVPAWGLQAVGAILGAATGALLGGLLDVCLTGFFRLFNWAFRHGTGLYTGAVGLALRGSAVVLVVYAGMLALTWWTSNQLPTGYIPNQDQGRFYIAVQLPDAASMERTQKVMDHIQQVVQPQEGVQYTTEVAGQSFTLNANGSNFGNFFVTFKPFEERRDPRLSAGTITDRVQKLLDQEVPEAKVSLFTPPPVAGLGSASGFKIIIEDRGDLGLRELQNQVERLMAAGNGGHFKLTDASLAALRAEGRPPPEPVLAALDGLKDKDHLTRDLFVAAVADVLNKADIQDKEERKRIMDLVLARAENPKVVSHLFSVFRANVPQLYADVNRQQCQTMGVNPKDVFDTLQIYLGSFYVNDFNRFGRTWQVNLQADGWFRDDPDKIKLLKVRNSRGEMVPLGSVLSIRQIGGPINIGRYNMYQAAAILGSTEPGVSSGQGIEEMERLCGEILPQGMAFEWTEINYMQVDAAKNIWNNLIFPLAVVFVFLVLAAQYESWALPLAVILVVPMCILGSLTGVAVTRTEFYTHLCEWLGVAVIPSDINIFTQIGFVVLVGLASKNAILIVEFAKHKKEEGGLSRHAATLAACRLRLRPILMTSFAFILGVVPLLVGNGAGFEMRRTLGVAVFSGMLGVTLFGIFLTPVFFNVIEWLVDTPLFSSERMRRVGRVLYFALGIATLGLIWLPRVLPHVLRRLQRVSVAWPARRKSFAGGNGKELVRDSVGRKHGSNGDSHRPNGDGLTPHGKDKVPPPDDRILPVPEK
jgi:multidrug efflux pump